MKTIWKYSLETTDLQIVEMPLGAKILSVQVQHEKPCLWCLVNPDDNSVIIKREIHIVGTGHEIDWSGLQADYIGSYQLQEGQFVGHVFELKN